ncbi:MAG: hypothetical protein AABX47_05725 [Nanoarchaeota archaeon]
MKTAYVQCLPISTSYANIIHMTEAARLTRADRFFLCVWDAVAFEDPAFYARSDGRRSRTEQVQETVAIHQRLLEATGAEVHTVYLSEAWGRLFSKPQLARLFNSILAKTKISELAEKTGLPGEDLSLSRINYTIADTLVAASFHKIFPEISPTAPMKYVTSRRLAPFMPAIKEVIRESGSRDGMPEIVWVAPFYFIIDTKGIVPSIEMNDRRIYGVMKDAFLARPPKNIDISRLYSLMGIDPKRRKMQTTVPGNSVEENEADSIASSLAHDMHRWFLKVKSSIERPLPKNEARSVKVTNPDQFHRSVRPLSAVKLRILSLCDGTRTSYHIARALGLKQVTVSVYLGRLRAIGIVSEGRRPIRTVSSLIVDLDAMANPGKTKVKETERAVKDPRPQNAPERWV